MNAHTLAAEDLLTRCLDDDAWQDRLNEDVEEVLAAQDPSLRGLVKEVVSRSRALGAEGVALTGSAARGRQTAISDVDFLVVGPRPRIDQSMIEVDLRALSAGELMARLQAGDEYVQWALRFGCIVHDEGIFREASRVLLRAGIWPDPERKRLHARTLLRVATRILESGDREAAEESARATLTALAHWILLSNRLFPLSRDELSDQILELGSFDLAAALRRSIHSESDLDELAAMLQLARHGVELTPRQARSMTIPAAA